MTQQEFIFHYEKLKKEFPQQFSSDIRRDLIAKHVMKLSEKFWAGIVSRIILTNNPRLDIEDAARGERIANGNLRLAQDITVAYETFAKNISEAGLSESLKQFDAKSLWEAIEKSKRAVGNDGKA